MDVGWIMDVGWTQLWDTHAQTSFNQKSETQRPTCQIFLAWLNDLVFSHNFNGEKGDTREHVAKLQGETL